MIDKQDIAFIVIGDVHGRKFWENAVGYEQDAPVIFLGDYLDPYPHEKITSPEAIENFKEILDYAKANRNVHLLYGNHDSYAFNDLELCSCRHDMGRYDEICQIYRDNEGLFKFAHDETVGNTRFLMTHAGVHPEWYENWSDIYGEDFKWTADEINMAKDKRGFMASLRTLSFRRGGYYDYGSILWCDVRDYLGIVSYSKMPENVTQIFGHTMLMKAFGFKRFCTLIDVDCQRAVFVDKNGSVRYLDDGVPIDMEPEDANEKEDNKKE